MGGVPTLWHGQLFHGGSAIRTRKKTLRSLITHHWREKDLGTVHGRVGLGRYYLVRPPQQLN